MNERPLSENYKTTPKKTFVGKKYEKKYKLDTGESNQTSKHFHVANCVVCVLIYPEKVHWVGPQEDAPEEEEERSLGAAGLAKHQCPINFEKKLYCLLNCLHAKRVCFHQMSRNTGRNVLLLLFSPSRNFMISSWPCLAARSRGVLRLRSLGSRSTLLWISRKK